MQHFWSSSASRPHRGLFVSPVALARVVAFSLLIAAPSPGQPGGGGPPPAFVRVGAVEMREVQRRIGVTGQVRPFREARVASREPGRLLESLVREGDVVAAGQPLATLDDSLLRPQAEAAAADVAAAEATLEERGADLERAERDLARMSSVSERGAANPNELDDSRTALTRARARRAQAVAELAAARARLAEFSQRLEDMTIRAPFGGRVVARLVESGEWADRGDAIAEVVDLARVEAWLDVPERVVAAWTAAGRERGVPATPIRVEARAIGEFFDVAEYAVVPRGDQAARTFPVRIVMENPRGALKPGMSVTAQAPAGESAPTLVLPTDALLRDDAGWFVYTATGDKPEGRVAVPARVELLFTFGTEAAVRVVSGPLFPGAAVVVEGNERILFPGQPLNITNPEALPAPPASSSPPTPAAGGAPAGAAEGAR